VSPKLDLRAGAAVPRWALAAALALALALACVPATIARAGTLASVSPSFSPDRLGASTTFGFDARFSGGEDGIPAPLSHVVVHLPAGLGISFTGMPSCSAGVLRARGPRACPTGSRIGGGSTLVEVRFGSETISEEATVQIFAGPSHSGARALEFTAQGLTPLEERVTFAGLLEPDRAPYGMKLVMSIPEVPTLATLPGASTVRLSLRVGPAGAGRGAARVAGSIHVPRACPAGGFPFATDFAFADGSTSGPTAHVRCP
jgi:hypothetical protein